MSLVFYSAPDGEVDSETAQGISAVTGCTEGSGTQTEAQQALSSFWPRVMDEIRRVGPHDFKTQALPLARIKKIMKLDDEVKMISSEAPMLFAKAAEIFIHELTLRAWIHTEDNKRRTLQKNDIAMAISKFDQFDFLIDIVPRDEIKPNKAKDNTLQASMNPDQVHYYFQLAQQHQAALQQSAQIVSANCPTTTLPTIQIVQPGTNQIQTVEQVSASSSANTGTTTSVVAQPTQVQTQQPAQVIQVQSPAQVQNAGSGLQIVQQIVTPTGEIQHVPIQLTQSQLQMIRMQVQNGNNQPIIIQATPVQTSQQPQIIQVIEQK